MTRSTIYALLAPLLLVLTPLASATTNTWTDASGDEGITGQTSLDLTSLTFASDGTSITVTVGSASLAATGPHAVYRTSVEVVRGSISLDVVCNVGQAPAWDPTATPGCTAYIDTVVGVVGIATAVPTTTTFDYTANTVTASATYTDLGFTSGQSVNVIAASSGQGLPVIGEGAPELGDMVIAHQSVTLA